MENWYLVHWHSLKPCHALLIDPLEIILIEVSEGEGDRLRSDEIVEFLLMSKQRAKLFFDKALLDGELVPGCSSDKLRSKLSQ